MELLKTILVIALLTTTSAKPIRFRKHHDADIADRNLVHANRRFTPDTSSSKDSSKESRSSSSSEELSSDEVVVPDVTTPIMTSVAMTTAEDGSTPTPEVDTIGTDQPIVMETTPPPATPTTSVNFTSPCDECFTLVIPTTAPITNNRGDN